MKAALAALWNVAGFIGGVVVATFILSPALPLGLIGFTFWIAQGICDGLGWLCGKVPALCASGFTRYLAIAGPRFERTCALMRRLRGKPAPAPAAMRRAGAR